LDFYKRSSWYENLALALPRLSVRAVVTPWHDHGGLHDEREDRGRVME